MKKCILVFIAGLLALLMAGMGEVMASEPVDEVGYLLPEMEVGAFTGCQGVAIVYGIREVEVDAVRRTHPPR